jgi:hypothetical protein
VFQQCAAAFLEFNHALIVGECHNAEAMRFFWRD